MSEEKDKYAAQKKYQEKAGYVSKSYKLKQDVVEAFANACDAAGVSQASQLTKMMMEFVEQIETGK